MKEKDNILYIGKKETVVSLLSMGALSLAFAVAELITQYGFWMKLLISMMFFVFAFIVYKFTE